MELGVGFEDVVGYGAHDVDAEVMVFGVLKGGGDEFEADALAALTLGDFGVPDGHPALAVGFEFEIAGFAFALDFETAAGYLGWVVHGRLPYPLIIEAPVRQSEWSRGIPHLPTTGRCGAPDIGCGARPGPPAGGRPAPEATGEANVGAGFWHNACISA